MSVVEEQKNLKRNACAVKYTYTDILVHAITKRVRCKCHWLQLFTMTSIFFVEALNLNAVIQPYTLLFYPTEFLVKIEF